MIQVKHIKKVAILLLVLVTTFTLVACNKQTKVPYGNVDTTNYVTVGDTKLTNKDLYNNLRRQSVSTLTSMIHKELFKGYYPAAIALLETQNADEKSDAEWAQNLFDELVNAAIFENTDVESLKTIPDFNKQVAIEKYVDALYLSGETADRAALISDITTIVSDTDDEAFATGYYTITDLKAKYILDLQKRLYSKEALVKDQEDEKNDNYISDQHVITYYENEEKGNQDAKVFYFHFLSAGEAQAAQRIRGVKASGTKGQWFEIPNLTSPTEPAGLSSDQEAQNQITKLNLSVYDGAGAYQPISDGDYKKFWDAYNPSAASGAQPLNAEEVQLLFIDLYNIVNTKEIEIQNDEIVYKTSGDKYEVDYTREELTKVNSSFASYIYNDLTEEKPYSTLRSVGAFRYLAFVLEPIQKEINYVSETRDDDNNKVWVTIDELKEIYSYEGTDKAKLEAKEDLKDALGAGFANTDAEWTALKDEMQDNKDAWYDEVKLNKNTSTYANNKISKLTDDELKVEIYDNIIRALYNQSATTAAKGSDKDGNVVALIKGELNGEKITIEIKVDDLFAELEKIYGVSAASDEIVNIMLLNEWKKADHGIFKNVADEINEQDFNTEYKKLIKDFSADQFAQSGYPASIGREAFLLLLFGSTDKKETIEKGFLIPELRTLFTNDFDVLNLDGTENTEIYENLATFAARSHELSTGLSVGHLLVYFDEDGDGNPEDPQEYLDSLEDQAAVTATKEAIVDLYYEIDALLGTPAYGGFGAANGLGKIVESFQNTVRIPTELPSNYNWEKYRQLGINLKYEVLPGEITNISNFPTNQSTLDKVFYDRAMYLYNLLIDSVTEKENHSEVQYFDFSTYFTEDVVDPHGTSVDLIKLLTKDAVELDGETVPSIMSNFGIHFINVTSISTKKSANYAADKDTDGSYKIDDRINAYNENTTGALEAHQIEYYIKGQKLETQVLVPSVVSTALTTYYQPVMAMYNNQYNKSEIMFKLLTTQTVTFTDSANNTKFAAVRAINQNQFHNYLTDAVNGNDNYKALYGDWFDVFKTI